MANVIVISPFPSNGTSFEISSARVITTNNHSVGIVHIADEVIKFV